MARKDDTEHFLRFSLVAVFLVAVISIVGIVALLSSGVPTGMELASADNVAGQATEGTAKLCTSMCSDYSGDAQDYNVCLKQCLGRLSTGQANDVTGSANVAGSAFRLTRPKTCPPYCAD